MSELTDTDFAELKIIVLVLGGKGGIAKSLVAQICANRLRTIFSAVITIDTDHTNNTTASIDPDARMLDIWDVKARGALAVLIDEMKKSTACAAVIDTGAQEDTPMMEIMEWLVKEATRAGVLVVAVLPITLATHNQRTAVEFSNLAEQLSLPLVYVKNLGQGRTREDFARRWDKSNARAGALSRGAVETELRDAGARYADEAGGYGLSLADAALGRFGKAGTKAEEAAACFDPSDRAWLNIFLSENGGNLLSAVTEAIAKRRRLDVAKER